ncbi:CCE_0567 family metalloprotein [Psychromonas sp. KJ10-10]|uniref:CCE_0567 family metalloprotein n=1 Tax=Psychromonas sp. KJ10-10 TaxID=3391823 RepID=UPI0039B58226
MALTDEQKELKKELAKYKRKVMEIAGVMHDIVEDSIWLDYQKLSGLSKDIEVAMEVVNEFKAKHEFLK